MWRDGQQRSHTEIVRILHVIGMWRKSVESEKCVSCKFSKTEKNKSNGMEKRTKTDKKHTTKCRWLICRNVNADRDKYFLVRRHSSQLDSIQLLARKTPIFLSSFFGDFVHVMSGDALTGQFTVWPAYWLPQLAIRYRPFFSIFRTQWWVTATYRSPYLIYRYEPIEWVPISTGNIFPRRVPKKTKHNFVWVCVADARL